MALSGYLVNENLCSFHDLSPGPDIIWRRKGQSTILSDSDKYANTVDQMLAMQLFHPFLLSLNISIHHRLGTRNYNSPLVVDHNIPHLHFCKHISKYDFAWIILFSIFPSCFEPFWMLTIVIKIRYAYSVNFLFLTSSFMNNYLACYGQIVVSVLCINSGSQLVKCMFHW